MFDSRCYYGDIRQYCVVLGRSTQAYRHRKQNWWRVRECCSTAPVRCADAALKVLVLCSVLMGKKIVKWMHQTLSFEVCVCVSYYDDNNISNLMGIKS